MILFVCISGCGRGEIPSRLIPEAEAAFARDYHQRIRDGDFEYVKSYLDAEIRDEVTDEWLRQFAEFFPSGELISAEVIGSHVNTFNSRWEGNITFDYQFSGGWAVANVAIRRVDGETTVFGLSVHPTEASQRELTAFSAAAITPLHVAMLIGTIASPIFMLFTCYFVFKTPIARRKWLWYVLSFLGIGAVNFNWTTGAVGLQLLSIQLIGFGITSAGAAAPWIFSFTVPIGAAVFWMRRKTLASSKMVNTLEDSPDDVVSNTKDP